LPVKSSWTSRTWPESKRKLSCGFVLLKLFFEWLKTVCRVQVYLREETLQQAQVGLTKMPRDEAKIYQETDFYRTKGHLLTSSG